MAAGLRVKGELKSFIFLQQCIVHTELIVCAKCYCCVFFPYRDIEVKILHLNYANVWFYVTGSREALVIY